MELENEGNYHIGQYVEGFIETEWKPCLITSMKGSIPVEYGVTTIQKGRSFYLYAESLRVRHEKLVMVEDSLDESGLLLEEEINFSLVTSDDESLFITQSNPVNNSINDSDHESDCNPMEDSLLDFAREADALLTLDSHGESAEIDVNGKCEGGSPAKSFTVNSANISLNDPNTVTEVAIDEYSVPIVDGNVSQMPDKEPHGQVAENEPLVTEGSDRFPEVSDAELENLQRASKSERTHKQTLWGVKILTDWLQAKGKSQDFAQIPDEQLADLLKSFYASARTKDGKLYSKASLFSIRAAIQRCLQGAPHNRNINLISGPPFAQANQIITGTIKKMRQEGNDKSTRHTPIAPEDMVKLYTSGAFLTTTPTTLQNKVFFELSLHFGRRGREGLRELKRDMIVVQTDATGKKFATLGCQAHEKNYQGAGSHGPIEHLQRLYETNTQFCPLVSLQSYISHLNPDCEWFFQRPKTTNFLGKVIWYNDRAMGVNAIANFMVRIGTAANLSRRYTNHCIRATTVTTLREAGIAPNDIAAVTGHRNLASIDHYSRTTDNQRAAMSNELAKACVPVTNSPTHAVHNSPKRRVVTEEYSKSTTTISSPAKGPDCDDGEIVTTVSLEKGMKVEEATEIAKSVLAGAIFHGPVTLNINFQ